MASCKDQIQLHQSNKPRVATFMPVYRGSFWDLANSSKGHLLRATRQRASHQIGRIIIGQFAERTTDQKGQHVEVQLFRKTV